MSKLRESIVNFVLIAIIAFLVAFFTLNARAEGIEYQEGIDTHFSSSCTPPSSRTDGVPIEPDEMDITKIVVTQDTLFTSVEKEWQVDNIFCNRDIPLAELPDYGQWHKKAAVHAIEGGWSELSTEYKSFVWLQAIAPPVDLGPEIPQSGMSIHYVSSEELVNWNMPATNAIDGDHATLWHSQYQGDDNTEIPMPHIIEFGLGDRYMVTGVQLQPRASGGNAVIKNFMLYSSLDSTSWRLAHTGTLPAGDVVQSIELPGDHARFIQLMITSEQNGGQQASLAEFRAYGEVYVPAPPGPPTNLN